MTLFRLTVKEKNIIRRMKERKKEKKKWGENPQEDDVVTVLLRASPTALSFTLSYC